MKHIEIPGGWYSDARLDGMYVCLVGESHIESSIGRLNLPSGRVNVLFPRLPRFGPFKFAGQSNVTDGPNLEYLFGAYHPRIPHSYGVNPVIYLDDGTLLENVEEFGLGVQGYRFVDEFGKVWTGDETYADPVRGFWEWSRLYGYTAGRVPVTSATDRVVIQLPDGDRRMIADEGRYLPNSIHYDTDAVNHVITYTDERTQTTHIVWCTSIELVTKFPPEPSPEPEPPTPRPLCTIASYPSRITLGDPAVAVAVYSGGPATRAKWLYQSVGEVLWITAGVQSPPGSSFDYGPHFETWGEYRIALMVEGPGGSDETVTERRIVVEELTEPEPMPTRQQVAFGPNLGSLDLPQLATESNLWQWSYDRVSAFQLYVGHIIEPGSNFVRPNTWDVLVDSGLFRKFKDAGILLELQMAGESSQQVSDCAFKIANEGGQLGAICFDHAFHETGPTFWSTRLKEIKALYPSMVIGAYAPFPFKTVEDIRKRLVEWDSLGGRPDFLRMDVDYNQRDRYTSDVHRRMREMCDDRGIAVQVVINAKEGLSDAAYVTQGKAWFDKAVSLGKWDALMVQSWASTPSDEQRELPHNLNEDDPTAHTNLLRYVLERFV